MSDAPWIALPVGAKGSGSGSLQLQVARSAVTSARSGVVHLPELGLSFTVEQAAAPADPGFSSFLRLVSGTVAGQAVDPDHRTIHVSPGAAITGTLNLRIDSTFGSNAVMALGITPSWGDPATSYTNLPSFATPVAALTRAVTLRYTAPSLPGTYHIVAAFRGEYNAGQVLSATNWSVPSPVWNNGDDIAAWSNATLAAANRDGTVLVDYLLDRGNAPAWVPATSIAVEVGSP